MAILHPFAVASFALFVTHLTSSVGEVFSAQSDLVGVFRLEKEVADHLQRFIAKSEKKLEAVRKYLLAFETWDEKLEDGPESYEQLAGNPLLAYHLFKRLDTEWEQIKDGINIDDWKSTTKKIDRSKAQGDNPRQEDLYGAAQALIRIQDVYELKPSDICTGNVFGIQTSAVLKAEDCLYLGKHSYNAQLYTRAVEWFEQAHLLAGQEENVTVSQQDVQSFLTLATTAHDQTWEKRPFSEHLYKEPLSRKRAALQRQEKIENRNYVLGNSILPRQENENFNALCRGEQLVDAKRLSKLKCWRDTRNNPYFILMPINVERNSLDLELYSFYDVITDKEIEIVEGLAKPHLTRAMVQGASPDKTLVSNVRTSKVAWLNEDQHPILDKISKRIKMITGLNAMSTNQEAELFQIANYGIGGHYTPHHDYLIRDKTPAQLKKMEPQDVAMGDRIATFMLYLSDVTMGGATAFPRIGSAIQPRKGAAVFWYNLKKSGKPDRASLHGACPVVFGHKWVSNKWIREAAQVFVRKCSTDIND